MQAHESLPSRRNWTQLCPTLSACLGSLAGKSGRTRPCGNLPLVSYERPSLAPTILATNRASAIFDAVPAHHEHNRTKFEAQLARHPYARAASGRFWYTNRWSLSRVTIIFPEHPGKYYCGLLEVTLALY
jgi:hypothetical protein